MIRLLARTPRGTWLLAGAVWLAGCGALWCVLPYRPRAAWVTEVPALVHGFIPGQYVVLTSSLWSTAIDRLPWPFNGPLVARDVATGAVRAWLPDSERLTVVEPGPDGRYVVIGRVVDGRARLFLHDAGNGRVIVELPRDGPCAENENEHPPDSGEQFVAFRPDGQRLVYADWGGGERWLRVWDVGTQNGVAALPGAGPVAAWSPDGQSLACATLAREDRALLLWNLQTGQARVLGSSVMGRQAQYRFSPDGQTVIGVLPGVGHFAGGEPYVAIAGWQVASGKQTFHRQMRRAEFASGTPWFVIEEWSESGNLCVHRCDYATGAQQDRVVLSEFASAMWGSLSPDGGLILGNDVIDNPMLEFLNRHVLRGAIETDERLVLWETGTGRRKYVLPTDAGVNLQYVQAWSQDGRLLVIAGADDLTVWDIPPRKSVTWFAGGAALLAFPPIVIARRRVRRIWMEAAA